MKKATNPSQYGLASPALQVELSEKDNKSQKLLIGDDTPIGSAVYAMLAGDSRVFTIASFTKTSLDKSVNDLRDRRLITATADNISRIELIKKGFGLEFDRNKDQWQILRPKPLRANNIEVSDLVRQLTEAKMDTTADVVKASSDFAKATTVATAKVTDQSGTQQLEIRKVGDDYFAKSSTLEGAYKVDSALGKQVEKSLDDFRNKSLFDFGFSALNKIEIHDGEKAYLLTRGTAGEDDWWSNGKKMDSTKANDLVSKLRELSASGFADSGFSNPTVELVVTSNDGKRTENVSIAKFRDGYLAQRKGEPALYKLTSDQVNDLVKAAAAL